MFWTRCAQSSLVEPLSDAYYIFHRFRGTRLPSSFSEDSLRCSSIVWFRFWRSSRRSSRAEKIHRFSYRGFGCRWAYLKSKATCVGLCLSCAYRLHILGVRYRLLDGLVACDGCFKSVLLLFKGFRNVFEDFFDFGLNVSSVSYV